MPKCVVDKRPGLPAKRIVVGGEVFSICIPGVTVKSVVQQIAVSIVACAAESVSVSALVIARHPGNRATLGEIAERVVAESLRPNRRAARCGAVDAGNPTDVVGLVAASLSVCRVKGIGNG